jgi:hypothetical protein
MSQPLLDVAATICRLTVTGRLPLCGLPWVSLPKASLACNVPPCPKGLTSGPRALFPWSFGELLVLVCHAHCVTLPREWPIMPRGH